MRVSKEISQEQDWFSQRKCVEELRIVAYEDGALVVKLVRPLEEAVCDSDAGYALEQYGRLVLVKTPLFHHQYLEAGVVGHRLEGDID